MMGRWFRLIGVLWLCLAGWGLRPVFAAGPDGYVVQPGDTLYSIAGRYGLSADQLAAANGLAINSWLYTGQQLIIPGTGGSGPAAPAAPIAPTASTTYVVRQGDTLARIAASYGTTVADLAAANNLANANAIYGGQQLVIPGSPAAAPAAPAPPTGQPIINLGNGDWIEVQPAWAGVWQPLPGSPELPPPTIGPIQVPTPAAGGLAPVTSLGEKWVDVNLTSQTLTAYEGQTPVLNTLISSGLWQYPTVVGTFSIYVKYLSTRMTGGYGLDYYDLPDVPYVMYFYRGYGLHGTYWHNNFGTPMSHGCVNLATPDAEWLYNWAPVGTKVVTHY